MPSEMIQLSPNLWVIQSSIYAMNSAIWLHNGAACLVDPGVLPDEIETIATWLEARGAQSHYLVLTHGHWDHFLGVQRFPGVPVVAHAGYWPEMGKRKAGSLAFLIRNHLIPPDGSFDVPHPELLIHEAMTLHLGDLAIRLLPTPGHAPDHLSLYEAASGALVAGDILSDAEMPSVMDSLVAYERSLTMLTAYAVRVLVPGHGQATADQAEIERRFCRERDYLAGLRAGVEDALRQGLTAEETMARCAALAQPYPGFEETNQLNIESVYVELGGPGNPDEVGWERARRTPAEPEESAGA